MIHISLPKSDTRRLSFYLAMEEFVARNINQDEDCFFMWQVEPSVIFGRNQLIENEVNMAYCRENDIKTYRRKSGGGCVYADMSNIMFSYITRSENVSLTFDRYINMVAEMLRGLNVPAEATGRNDIMIEGRKVSGNAFYHIPHHSIVHGTMLYDTNMKNMVATLTPSDEKLISKGVKSVRQRIALLKDYIDLSLEEFKQYTIDHLCNSETMLSASDVREIEEIEKEYLTDEFIRDKHNSIHRYYRLHAKQPHSIEMALAYDIKCPRCKGNDLKQVGRCKNFYTLGLYECPVCDRDQKGTRK